MTSVEPGLSLIVAVARNGVIGNAGALPWHISEDLKHFKRTTLGHAVIMGRKTFESIGRPLPKRRNIVVSRRSDATFEGCETARSLQDAIALARRTDPNPFIIGGASLYREAMPLATDIHLTTIESDFDGDVHFFPDLSAFDVIDRREGQTEGLIFQHLRRKPH